MYGIRIPALLLVMGAIAAACAGDVSNPTPTPTPTLAPTPASTAIPIEATPTSPSTEEPPDRDLIDLARRFRGLPPDTLSIFSLSIARI
ncbi:MAG: hypothetical protein ACE1ZN_00370 [Dehalococcoidia bacterium]